MENVQRSRVAHFWPIMIFMVALIGASCSTAGATSGPPKARFALAADSFDDPDNGLFPRSSSNPDRTNMGYVNGRYILQTVDPDWDYMAIAQTQGVFNDTITSVDVQVARATEATVVNLTCRAAKYGDTGYSLYISPGNGDAGIMRRDGGTPITLADNMSTAVHMGTGVNHATLLCSGDSITAWVNGHQVASVRDSHYASGRQWIGVGVFLGQQGVVAAEFDNFVIGAAP